jgi:uncharacterized cupin superfamily protein
MREATITETETGKQVEGEGWFVLNLGEATWERDSDHGVYCTFEARDARFEHYGVNVHVVAPGQPNARYHRESNQEDFLVLAGECVAIVEGQERRLRQWDLLHCPPGAEHVIVGAGDGPCAILMIGKRDPDEDVHYPVNEVAARYGASVREPTDVPREAYADLERRRTAERAPWPPSADPS